jgi:probable pyridine nucleotide-disulfide oxidoreductase
MNLTADLLVIGFGTAGKLIAAAMGNRGAKVVMVEQNDHMYGGTCINTGCVPTKSLVHLAETRFGGADPAEWFRTSALRTKHLTGVLPSPSHRG